MRVSVALTLWAVLFLGHRTGQALFFHWSLAVGPAAQAGVRWASVGVVLLLAAWGLARGTPGERLRRAGVAGLTAGLVATGHTAGELLHVAEYALLAWIGGPSPAWLLAAGVDEAWEAVGGAPFDVADVLLDAVGLLVVRAAAAPLRAVAPTRGPTTEG